MSKWAVNILKIEMILRDKSVLKNIQSIKQTMITEFEKRRRFYVVSKFSVRSRIGQYLGYEVR